MTNLSMSKSANKKSRKLGSSSSTEAASSTEGKENEAFESERSAAMHDETQRGLTVRGMQCSGTRIPYIFLFLSVGESTRAKQ